MNDKLRCPDLLRATPAMIHGLMPMAKPSESGLCSRVVAAGRRRSDGLSG